MSPKQGPSFEGLDPEAQQQQAAAAGISHQQVCHVFEGFTTSTKWVV
jgi:hypothetical protein